ncbi:MAG TPA: hypothetical protein VL287_12225, partial [Gemmatimonadales bacterium]|nr:hypothetical protein [Gemmatimonadales bacterium]
MARTAFRVLLGVLATGLVIALAGGLALYAGGATWIANRLLAAAVRSLPETTFRVRSVGGSLVSGLVLHDLELNRGPVGVPLHVDEVRVRYRLSRVLQHDIAIDQVHVIGPTAGLIQLRDSSWNFLPPVPKAKAQSTAPGRTIRIAVASVSRGQATVRFLGSGPAGSTLRVDDLELRARDLQLGAVLAVRLDTLGFRALPPGASPQWINVAAAGAVTGDRVALTRLNLRSPSSDVSAHGKVAIGQNDWRHPRDFDLSLTARPLSYRDLRSLGHRFEREENVTLELRSHGGSNQIAVNLEATSSNGGSMAVNGRGTPPGTVPIDYDLHGRVRGLDPGLLTGSAERTGSLSADFEALLKGPSLDHVDGTVRASFTGTRYGRMGARSGMVQARFKEGQASVQSHGDVAGVRFTAGGFVRPFDSVPSYDMKGQVRALAGAGKPSPMVERLVGREGLDMHLRVNGRGVDPKQANLKLLATTTSSESGRALLDSGRVEATVAGGVATFRARAGLTGGLVSLRGSARLEPEIGYRVDRGEIEGVDLLALLGDTAGSRVNGSFSLSGYGVTPRLATADGRVQVSRSTIGSHDLDEGRADVRLRSGVVGITGDANVDGAALALAAEATPFADRREVRVREVRFRNVDLARTAPGLRLSSDLSGTGTFKAS